MVGQGTIRFWNATISRQWQPLKPNDWILNGGLILKKILLLFLFASIKKISRSVAPQKGIFLTLDTLVACCISWGVNWFVSKRFLFYVTKSWTGKVSSCVQNTILIAPVMYLLTKKVTGKNSFQDTGLWINTKDL